MSAATTSEKEMPFLEHIRELRTCIIRALIGIALGTALAMSRTEEIFALLIQPLRLYFPNASLIGTGPSDAFMTKLMTGIVGGVLVSLPFSFLQLWSFVAPGLYENERRLVIPFVVLSTICFLLGAVFCYRIVLPVAFTFFGGEFESIRVVPQIRIEEYLAFTLKFILIFGSIFELPIITYFLARSGVLTHDWLIRQTRYAMVVIFIVAGILTPPDVVSQLLLAGPLLVLFAVCIGVAYLARPKHVPSS